MHRIYTTCDVTTTSCCCHSPFIYGCWIYQRSCMGAHVYSVYMLYTRNWCPVQCCNTFHVYTVYKPEVNRTMALRQLYSAESTWSALSFSTCSWKIRMWSMKATTRSAAIGLAWSPAAASSGATWRGIEHWAAFSTNSSLQASRSSATWSVTYKHQSHMNIHIGYVRHLCVLIICNKNTVISHFPSNVLCIIFKKERHTRQVLLGYSFIFISPQNGSI